MNGDEIVLTIHADGLERFAQTATAIIQDGLPASLALAFDALGDLANLTKVEAQVPIAKDERGVNGNDPDITGVSLLTLLSCLTLGSLWSR